MAQQQQAKAVSLLRQLSPTQAALGAVGKVTAVAGVDHGFGIAARADLLHKHIPQGLLAPPAFLGVLGDGLRLDQHHLSSRAPGVRR